MPPITTVARQLNAAPKPIICLDTCDILEVVQCLDWERPGSPRDVTCINSAQRLLNALAVNPNSAKVIITKLVHTEWNQNIAEIQQRAVDFLEKIDGIIHQTYQAAGFAGTVLPVYHPLSPSNLVADVVTLSTSLLNQAGELDLKSAFIKRALDRVMTKTRPSHDGHIKDSINFEHYLEFARCPRAGGFTENIAFVSKNKKDYWDGSNPRIHPDLEPQINDPAVQIRFFGSLHAALGYLHI